MVAILESQVEGSVAHTPASRKFGHVRVRSNLIVDGRDLAASTIFIMSSSHPIPKAVLYYDALSAWSLAGAFLSHRSFGPDYLTCFQCS